MGVLRPDENVTEFVLRASHDSANSPISQAIDRLKRATEHWLFSSEFSSGVRVAIDVARRLERVLIANRMARGKFSRNTVAAMETFQRGIERTVAPSTVRDAMHLVNDTLLVVASQREAAVEAQVTHVDPAPSHRPAETQGFATTIGQTLEELEAFNRVRRAHGTHATNGEAAATGADASPAPMEAPLTSSPRLVAAQGVLVDPIDPMARQWELDDDASSSLDAAPGDPGDEPRSIRKHALLAILILCGAFLVLRTMKYV